MIPLVSGKGEVEEGVNVPEVVHCDSLVKESMEDYWRQFLKAGDRGDILSEEATKF